MRECVDVIGLKRAWARAYNLLISDLKRALESQRTKGTAMEGLRLREKSAPLQQIST